MGRYTLRIHGSPIEDARSVLAVAAGISVEAPTGGALVVVVDAPTLEQAEDKVRLALPGEGSFSIARPAPLEDDPDE
jgi:hypothetical protein